eukprot:763109-Hanusia_phi.AAC.4
MPPRLSTSTRGKNRAAKVTSQLISSMSSELQLCSPIREPGSQGTRDSFASSLFQSPPPSLSSRLPISAQSSCYAASASRMAQPQ